MHGSNSFLNLRLTLQAHFAAKLVELGESFPVVYGKRTPTANALINAAPAWAQLRVYSNGTWLPRDPGLFQVTTYTREAHDPYEIELDRIGDLVKSIFDITGGIVLKDYRVDRTNPTVIVDPVENTHPVMLAVRYDDFDEIPGPSGTSEALNGKVHSFRVWYWRHTNSGV